MPPSIPNVAITYSMNGNKTVQEKTKHMRHISMSHI